MIREWVESQDTLFTIAIIGAYATVAATVPDALATVQQIIGTASQMQPPEPLFVTITDIIKTVLAILVALSLFVYQTLKAAEIGIKIFGKMRWKRGRNDCRRQKENDHE